MQQLPLGIVFDDEATFSNFYTKGHERIVFHMQQIVSKEYRERLIFLYGQAGTGKTHLLQACCHELLNKKQTVMYLTFQESFQVSPHMLDGLEQLNLICIDNIQHVVGNREVEELLMDLYNRIHEKASSHMIVSSNTPLNGLPFVLPDLRSRLGANMIFKLHPLAEVDKVAAFCMRAKAKGLEVSQEVVQYLLRHHRRSLTDLLSILNKLDEASLIAKHRLTLPFLKQVLENKFPNI